MINDPIKLFLFYSIPAIDDCINEGNREIVRERLENVVLGNEDITQEEIDNYFPAAAERRKKFAEEQGFLDWTIEAVRGYWRVGHNLLSIRPECKTKYGFLKNISLKGSYKIGVYVNEEGESTVLIPRYHTLAKVGDYISVHKGSLAEIIN